MYNNVIANGSAPSGSNRQAGIFARFTDTSGLKIKNNSFYNNATHDIYIYSDVPTDDADIDYNNYYRSSYTNAWHWKGTDYSTLATYQAASGNEAQSSTENPLFVDATAANFRLTATSPLINRGISVGLTTDAAQNTVPSGTAPDIGAYEYQETADNSASENPPVSSHAQSDTPTPNLNCITGWKHCITVGAKAHTEAGWLTSAQAPGIAVYIHNFTTPMDLFVTLKIHGAAAFPSLADAPKLPWQQPLSVVSEIYEVHAVSAFNGYPVTDNAQPYTVVLPYNLERVGTVPLSKLRIAAYNKEKNRWEVLRHNTVLSPDTKEIANTTMQFTYFVVVYQR